MAAAASSSASGSGGSSSNNSSTAKRPQVSDEAAFFEAAQTATRLVRERPRDRSAWLQLAQLQERATFLNKRARAEKRVAVLERALQADHVPDDEDLLLALLDAQAELLDAAGLVELWERVLTRQPHSQRLWLAYVRARLTRAFPLFSVPAMRRVAARAMAAVPSVELLEEIVRFEWEAGYEERAVGLCQAAIELSVCGTRNMNLLWDTRPRIGDDPAGAVRSPLLPVLAADVVDDSGDDDYVFRVVLFEDVEPFLLHVTDLADKERIVKILLSLFGKNQTKEEQDFARRVLQVCCEALPASTELRRMALALEAADAKAVRRLAKAFLGADERNAALWVAYADALAASSASGGGDAAVAVLDTASRAPFPGGQAAHVCWRLAQMLLESEEDDEKRAHAVNALERGAGGRPETPYSALCRAWLISMGDVSNEKNFEACAAHRSERVVCRERVRMALWGGAYEHSLRRELEAGLCLFPDDKVLVEMCVATQPPEVWLALDNAHVWRAVWLDEEARKQLSAEAVDACFERVARAFPAETWRRVAAESKDSFVRAVHHAPWDRALWEVGVKRWLAADDSGMLAAAKHQLMVRLRRREDGEFGVERKGKNQ